MLGDLPPPSSIKVYTGSDNIVSNYLYNSSVESIRIYFPVLWVFRSPVNVSQLWVPTRKCWLSCPSLTKSQTVYPAVGFSFQSYFGIVTKCYFCLFSVFSWNLYSPLKTTKSSQHWSLELLSTTMSNSATLTWALSETLCQYALGWSEFTLGRVHQQLWCTTILAHNTGRYWSLPQDDTIDYSIVEV